MNVKTLLILLISSLLFTGCGITELFVKTVPEQKTPLNLKEPNYVKMRDVKWFIITPENADEVFKELQNKKYDVVLYGLTDDGYKSLSINMAELRKYIIEQKEIIKSYKKYYEPQK